VKKSILIAFCFSILFVCHSFSQNRDSSYLETPFAKINENGFEFIIDTLKYKTSVSDAFFSKETKGTYDEIRILKSETLGEVNDTFFYINLYHYGKNLKTARYLKHDNGVLYLITDNDFGSVYVSCIGIDKKCSPNVTTDKNHNMKWICSNKVGVCSLDDNECKSVKSIILE
jgi:hypothetical protein